MAARTASGGGSGRGRGKGARRVMGSALLYAAVVFIWTAVFARTLWKYGQRGYRYVYMDAGHIAQNLALAAEATGLASCPIAALYDGQANSLVGVDGTAESVIYMTAVGYQA